MVTTLSLLATILAPPASAAVKSQAFSRTQTVHFADIGRCARVTMSGSLVFDQRIMGGRTRMVDNPTIHNPRVTMRTYVRTSSGTCTTTLVTVSKVKIHQAYSGYDCSYSPSLSVSFPFGVSFGSWRSCGSKQQASFERSYGSGSSYQQSNSGRSVQFADQSKPTPGGGWNVWRCYGMYSTLSVWRTSTSSDSARTSTFSICPVTNF